MSWAFNDKHMPSAHHPNPRDVGICGQGGGCPALGSSCRRNFWWGRYLPVPRDRGEASRTAERGPPQGSLRELLHLGLPLLRLLSPGSAPSRSVLGWGGRWCRPSGSFPRRGLQTTLPAWGPPSPPPSASSSPGRSTGIPRVHLARVPAAARRAASSEMLRLG